MVDRRSLKAAYREILLLRLSIIEHMLAKLSRSMIVHERRTPQSDRRDEGPND